QVGEEFLTHPPLPRGARVDRPHGALDVDHEFSHACAPRMPPMTLTKCRHSSRPSASRLAPFFVRWYTRRRGPRRSLSTARAARASLTTPPTMLRPAAAGPTPPEPENPPCSAGAVATPSA